MAITEDGWFDWAIRDPGHPDKVYGGLNSEEGIAWHSAEGWIPILRQLVKDFGRKASWTGSISLHGDLFQHYPVTAQCWASSSYGANKSTWSFELEGLAGDLPTVNQMRTIWRITAEFELRTGRKAVRALPGRTMWMHRELAHKFGAPPTSCPTNRYDGFFAQLEARKDEDDMTPEEVKAIAKEVAAEVVKEMIFGGKGRWEQLAQHKPLEARVNAAETGWGNELTERLLALEDEVYDGTLARLEDLRIVRANQG